MTPCWLRFLIGGSICICQARISANARACLGGTHWCADNVNGPGSQMDASNGQVESSRGKTDAPNALNGAETAVVSCSY